MFRCPVKGIRDCTEISGLDDVTRVVDNRTGMSYELDDEDMCQCGTKVVLMFTAGLVVIHT